MKCAFYLKNCLLWDLFIWLPFRSLNRQKMFVCLHFFTYLFTFQSAGISADKSQYATVGVGAIMVTMTIVTIPLMDRLGRRTLHFVSFGEQSFTSLKADLRQD